MEQDRLNEILAEHKKWLMTRFTYEVKGSCADLRGANLRGANLRGADLCDANLRDADLRDANLRDADLCDADLCDANLCGANLRDADLRDANLCGANLCDANLRGADTNERTCFYALQCPEEGSFIAYKKARGKIVKLLIPEDAKRSSATTRKCRCSKAKVLSITNIDGTDSGLNAVSSDHTKDFTYTVGETVEVEDYCDDRWIECASGIHFFITRQEAVNY